MGVPTAGSVLGTHSSVDLPEGVAPDALGVLGNL